MSGHQHSEIEYCADHGHHHDLPSPLECELCWQAMVCSECLIVPVDSTTTRRKVTTMTPAVATIHLQFHPSEGQYRHAVAQAGALIAATRSIGEGTLEISAIEWDNGEVITVTDQRHEIDTFGQPLTINIARLKDDSWFLSMANPHGVVNGAYPGIVGVLGELLEFLRAESAGSWVCTNTVTGQVI